MNTITNLRLGMSALMLALVPTATLAQTASTFAWRSAGDNAFLSHQRSAVVSPDGKTLYTSSQDNTLKVYDVATGRLMRTLVGSGNDLACIALSHDGKTIAAGGGIYLGRYGFYQPVADVWSAADYHHIETLNTTGETSTALAFSADDKTLAWATEDFSSSTHVFQATLLTYRVSDGTLLKTFTPAIGEVDEIAYAKDGKTLVAAGQRDAIDAKTSLLTSIPVAEIWDPVAATRKTTVKTRMNFILSARFSPDGTQLALGGGGGTNPNACIEIWDATGTTLKSTLSGATTGIRTIAYTSDGSTILGGGGAPGPNQTTIGMLETWKVATGKLTFSRKLTDRSAITTITDVNDGQNVIVESEIGEVSQLSATTGAVDVDYTHRIYGFSGVATSPNGLITAYAESAGTIRIANAATGAVLRTYTVANGVYVNTMAFSPDGSQVVIAQSNGLYVYGATTSAVRQLANIEYVNVTFAKAKSLMVTSRSFTDPKTNKDEEIIEGWDGATFKHIGQFTADMPSGYNLAVSADGSRVALCGGTHANVNGGTFYHGIVGIWNVADGKLLGSSDITAATSDEQLAAIDLSFSPNGKNLAVCYGDNNLNKDSVSGAVQIFNAANGQLQTTLSTTDYLNSIRYSADGAKLITAGFNQNTDRGTQTGSITIRSTQNNSILTNYTDDLGTGVAYIALNETMDQITIAQTDSTISTLNYTGI